MTDFSQYSHRQLVDMLFASDPGSVRSGAEAWDSAGGALSEQAANLDRQLADFRGGWTGGAAQQYQVMVNDLADGIRRVAASALQMRDVTYDSADALDQARAEMPQPVDVPDVSAATVTMATAPMEVPGDASAQQVATMQQQRTDAVTAVQQQQQASAASDAAHAKAIQVMNTLANHYSTNQQSMPESPNAAQAPNVSGPGVVAPKPVAPIVPPGSGTGDDGTDPTQPGGVAGGAGEVPGQAGSTSKPLFGNMFTAGLAAASAAAFGRFGSIMPRVPGFAKNKGEGKKGADGKLPGADSTKLGSGFGGAGGFDPAKLGGGGGIGGGGASIGGGGGIGAGEMPSADPGMSNAGGSATGAAIGAATGAAAGAARGMGGMPMMPMMPMTGAGMGDMGNRRVPPWLVETENVWGEPSVVAPGVIGDEQG